MRLQKAQYSIAVGTLVLCAWCLPLAAQTGYDKPPQYILDVLHAPSLPTPLVSPTHDTMLLGYVQNYPSIDRVATPYVRLAGVRVEPKNHSKHDTAGGYGITPCAIKLDLVHLPDGAQRAVELPAKVCMARPLWSADGTMFAFANTTADAVELWLGETKTGTVHKVAGVALNPIFGNDIQWMPDQKTLLVKMVPMGMGAMPAEPVVPIGPSIQETGGQKGESSTYENRDTLGNKHDEEVFDYFAASQMALVDAGSGAVTTIDKPGLYDEVKIAPDGQHVLIAAIHRPYSYVTTYDHFPREVEVWGYCGPGGCDEEDRGVAGVGGPCAGAGCAAGAEGF